MKLFHSPTSPFVRKVALVLKATGLEKEVEILDGSGTPVAPNGDVCDANPLGKIPALALDDGTILFDSRVICRFLNDRADAGLYPSGADLFHALTVEALADGIMDAAVLVVYESRIRPQELRYEPWVRAQMSKIHRALDDLESRCAGFGETSTIGAVAAACALGYLDFRYSETNWRESRPQLAEWFEKFSARADFRETAPK